MSGVKGYEKARLQVGVSYIHGTLAPMDHEAAFRWFKLCELPEAKVSVSEC